MPKIESSQRQLAGNDSCTTGPGSKNPVYQNRRGTNQPSAQTSANNRYNLRSSVGAPSGDPPEQYERANKTSRCVNVSEWAREKRQRPDHETKESQDELWVGSVAQYSGRGTANTSAEDYQLGDIVRVSHVIPSADTAANLKNSSVAWADLTGPIIAKIRPAIVVGVFKHSLTLLPMWTSNNRGFSRMESENSMWVRGWDQIGSHWDTTDELDYALIDPRSGFPAQNSSYINLTWIYYMPLSLPIIRGGNLTAESTQRLLNRWYISLDQGCLALGDQAEHVRRRKADLRRHLGTAREFHTVRQAVLQHQQAAADAAAAEVARTAPGTMVIDADAWTTIHPHKQRQRQGRNNKRRSDRGRGQ